jgi:hypothetical protein
MSEKALILNPNVEPNTYQLTKGKNSMRIDGGSRHSEFNRLGSPEYRLVASALARYICCAYSHVPAMIQQHMSNIDKWNMFAVTRALLAYLLQR